MKRILVYVIGLSLLFGCSSGGESTTQSITGTPVPVNMALLTIYHPAGEFSGAWSGSADVKINGVTVCSLSNSSYFNAVSQPGNLSITSTKLLNPGTSMVNIAAQPNQHYYIRITWNTGRNWTQAATGLLGAVVANATNDEKGPFIIEAVTEATAKPELQGLSTASGR